MWSTFTVLATITIVASKLYKNYCAIECLVGNQLLGQTLCRFPKNKHDGRCNDFVNKGLTSAEKLTVLQLHNDFRWRVALGNETRGDPGPQPCAADMRKLVWDMELEMVARRWARQCLFEEDPCPRVESFPVGQNRATITSEGNFTRNMTAMVVQWYDEVALFNRNRLLHLNQETSKNYGRYKHYLQMISYQTMKLGCELVLIQNSSNFVEYLVCNYGPRFDPNHRVYLLGNFCTACPLYTRCDEKQVGLCAEATFGGPAHFAIVLVGSALSFAGCWASV